MWRLYKRMVCTWTICWCEVMFRVGAWSLLWCFVTPSAGLPPVSVPVLCVSRGLQQWYHRVYSWMWTFWNLCDAGVHSSRCATKSTEMGKTLRKNRFYQRMIYDFIIIILWMSCQDFLGEQTKTKLLLIMNLVIIFTFYDEITNLLEHYLIIREDWNEAFRFHLLKLVSPLLF